MIRSLSLQDSASFSERNFACGFVVFAKGDMKI
jgi:hypothetical protein